MNAPVFLLFLAAAVGPLVAATTIDTSDRYAWAANLGWTNWAASPASGVVIGEYVCFGHIWVANCGWTSLGDGTPADGIRYSNSNGSDFGVNIRDAYSDGTTTRAKVRGLAYSSNIGWISFEDIGNPEISLVTGRLSGSAWSANCGWIPLSDTTNFLRSTKIRPGEDGDMDGIADAFELELSVPATLTKYTFVGDYDGDGHSDVEEYVAGTNPGDSRSNLAIISFVVSGDNHTLTWASSPSRIYRVCSSLTLLPGFWTTLLNDIAPDSDITSRQLTPEPQQKRFYRVEARAPLSP